jgi:hypothetical protein
MGLRSTVMPGGTFRDAENEYTTLFGVGLIMLAE